MKTPRETDTAIEAAVAEHFPNAETPTGVFDFGRIVEIEWPNRRATLLVTGTNGSRKFKVGSPDRGQAPLWDMARLESKMPVLMFPRVERAVGAADAFPRYAVSAPSSHLPLTDWSLLKGRDVVVYLDSMADQTAATVLQKAALAAGARISVIFQADEVSSDFAQMEKKVEKLRKSGAARTTGPDLAMASRRLSPVPDFDPTIFGAWGDWLEDAAAVKGAPIEYIAGSLIGAAGGLMAGKAFIEARSGWVEPSTIWTMIVGDSSAGKTPAMSAVSDAIENVERIFRRQHQQDVHAWEQGGKNGPKPRPTVVRIDDTTVEAAAVAMGRMGRGLLSWQWEATGWLGGLTRYNAESDRGFWLRAFDCKPASVLRRSLGEEPLQLRCLGSGIVAAAQPPVLESFLNSRADGLEARFNYFWPEVSELNDPDPAALLRWGNREAEVNRAIEAIVARAQCQGEHKSTLNAAARKVFFDWRKDYLTSLRAEHASEIPPALGKAPGLVLRLALLLQVLDDVAPTNQIKIVRTALITKGIMERALRLYDLMAAHRVRVEIAAKEPESERQARTLAKWIIRQGEDTIDMQAARRETGVRDQNAVRAALSELVAARWLAVEPKLRAYDPIPQSITLRPGLIDLAKSARK